MLGTQELNPPSQEGPVWRQNVKAQLPFELFSKKLLAGETGVWGEKLMYQLTQGEIMWYHKYHIHGRPQKQSGWGSIVKGSSTNPFTCNRAKNCPIHGLSCDWRICETPSNCVFSAPFHVEQSYSCDVTYESICRDDEIV